MPEQAFRLHMPAQLDTPVVFASPHSGRGYPWSFLRSSALDRRAIRSTEDAFVDDLFRCAPEHGAPLLAARAPRAFVDLNRDPADLDPAVVEDAPPVPGNRYVAAGLGVIPRVAGGGRAIRSGRISMAEATARIDAFWKPYHAALRARIDAAVAAFGQAILIDCHSMPSACMAQKPGRADIVLGDRFGAAAAEEVAARIETALRGAGFSVRRNVPYAGAYILGRYGRPRAGVHAVQIEIDRSLYMDERAIRRDPGYGSVKARLEAAVGEIAAIGRPAATGQPAFSAAHAP